MKWFDRGEKRDDHHTQRLSAYRTASWRRILVALTCAAVLLFAEPARAQRRAPVASRASRVIPEDQRPWPGKPWLAGIVLGLATIAIALKNAKRSHLD